MWIFLKRANVNLMLILTVYLVLAAAYSVVVPIGRGADEWAHYWYARFIVEHGRLPLNPVEREAAGYKSDWPPLYHLMTAALTAGVDTAGPPAFKYRADQVRRQLIPAQGSDAILHTEDERFPWSQEVLVWHLGRFLSIVFAAGALVVTYFIALEVFSKVAGSRVAIRNSQFIIHNSQLLSLLSVSVLAFNPRFLFTGMVFGYDSLTLLLASLFLWLAIRVANGRHLRWGFWGLGALAGLALVTKYLAALLPVVVVYLAASSKITSNKVAGSRVADTPHVSRLTPYASRLGQAFLAYLLIVGWWFGYLLVNFNEIDAYGPVLGTLAPLLRGDASDRTVETLFAWLSGGQAPPPAYIEKQVYTAWQIIAELPTTFWGNPVMRPYPLTWFVAVMTLAALGAVMGLIIWRRVSAIGELYPQSRRLFSLLILYCLLPFPFMLIRLFGARDALEAVQGRHLLFLAGPAAAILLVWGWVSVTCHVSRITYHVSRITFYALPGLLLTAALIQLIWMTQVYPPLLPAQTTPYVKQMTSVPDISLPGGAKLVDYTVTSPSLLTPLSSLTVSLLWQSGDQPAPEDYQVELALVDAAGQVRSSWQAYQTQAHYPTRAWEPGDTIRDEGWLPLVDLPAGDYEVRLRILGQTGPVVNWVTLTTYSLDVESNLKFDLPPGWLLWQNGQPVSRPPLLRERETAQFTFSSPLPALRGPAGATRLPVSSSLTWANFIIGPEWPAGEYYLETSNEVVLRVTENGRNFQTPAIKYPLNANFEGQIKLLGYDLPSRRVKPGDGLPVTLYWQGLKWPGEEFVIFTRLVDNAQVARGGRDRLPQENYSPLLWAPGEIVADSFAVPTTVDTPPGIYTLNLGWYRLVKGEAQSLYLLNSETGQAAETTAVTLGPVKVGGPPPGVTVTQAAPQTPVNIDLGGQIKLLGFDEGRPPRGASLILTFYWQALTPPPADYTVFTHIRDAAGKVAAQKDAPPAGGAYPTGLWEAGEIIKDTINVPLGQLKPGKYEVVVGMYDFKTGQRLLIPGALENAIVLPSFEVSAPAN